VAGELNKVGDGAAKVSCKGQLLAAGAAFGLLRENPETWLKGAATDDAGDIDALIAARNAARQSKDFAEADRIRDELAARGVVLEDGAGGTTWRRAG
jgi:cysteinyl-tRNA synthetase